MSALAEKIKSLADSSNFYNEVIEILLELEARQPNYTIQILPAPGPFPAAGPIYPWPSNPIPSTVPYPNPSFPRIGDPSWPYGTICHNANSNGPEPQSDPTGYVEPVGTLKMVGDGTPRNPSFAVYDRDVVKSLERKIEEDGTNKFVVTKLEGLGPNATGSEFKVGYGG